MIGWRDHIGEYPRTFFERLGLSALLIIASVSLAAAMVSFASGSELAGKFFATASTLSIMSGILQLEVSGLFTRMIEHYQDSELGPPSSVTRRILVLYSPERWWSKLWGDLFFFEPRTGFWLVFGGTALGLGATWL